jgi:integrase/recombinase XerD
MIRRIQGGEHCRPCNGDSHHPNRRETKGGLSLVHTGQRAGQVVRGVAKAAGIAKRIHPHLLRHTVATRLSALGMDITDVQRFLGHDDIGTARLYAETSVTKLRRKEVRANGRYFHGQAAVTAGRSLGPVSAEARGGLIDPI